MNNLRNSQKGMVCLWYGEGICLKAVRKKTKYMVYKAVTNQLSSKKFSEYAISNIGVNNSVKNAEVLKKSSLNISLR